MSGVDSLIRVVMFTLVERNLQHLRHLRSR